MITPIELIYKITSFQLFKSNERKYLRIRIFLKWITRIELFTLLILFIYGGLTL